MSGTNRDQVWLKLLPERFRTKIQGRFNLQKIITSAGWLFADKISRMGVGLIVGAWVARYLGPAQFGVLNYALAFVFLISPLASLGLDRIVIRNILRDPSRKEETLGTSFLLKLISGISTLFLSIIIIVIVRPEDRLVQVLVAITALSMVVQAFDVIDFWFQSKTQAQNVVYARNAAFLTISLLKILLIVSSAPLVWFAWAFFAEIAIAAIGLMFYYRRDGQTLKAWRANCEQARSLLSDSWPLILSGLSIMIYMRIDQIMLGELSGNRAVGIYSAVTKISEVWYFVPTVIVSSLFPTLIRIRTQDEQMYYRRLQKLFSLMTILAIGISIPVTFLSTKIMAMLFGDNFADGGGILAVHIWASLFVFLSVVQGQWDVSEDLTRLRFWRTSAGALINIVLNFILIPRYEAMGAAVATVISYACSAYLLNTFHWKTRPIFIQQTRSLFFVDIFWSIR